MPLPSASSRLGRVAPAPPGSFTWALGSTHTCPLRRWPASSDRFGWPDWPTLVGVALLFAAVGLRPVNRWARRRTEDPARSTTRYLYMLLGSWIAGLAGMAAVLWLLRPFVPSHVAAIAAEVMQIAGALLPFAGITLIERVRPGRLHHPAGSVGAAERAA